MRIIFFLLLVIVTTKPVNAQAPKTPSKTEMQSQMKEIINELNKQVKELEKQIADAKKNNEDPESIKQMEDELAMLKKQVAMMGGVTKGLSNISDKTFQKAIEEENAEGVPKRDNERLNELPKKPLNDVELNLFVQKAFAAIDNKMSLSQKKNAKGLYDEINLKEKAPDASGMAAVQCWLAGSTDMAIWILGKACMDDMKRTDNLANYASLLSMVGGEHLAIPIFQNLLQKFPTNTTILNNLGQVWYGLGDLNNAKQCLGAAVRFASAHPHANETISEIELAKGNSEESIETLKRSIKETYTPEKEATLNRKGVQLKYDDINFPECSKAAGTGGGASQLGFGKFISLIPEYPMAGGKTASNLNEDWYDFRQKVQQAIEALEAEQLLLNQKAQAYQNQLRDNPYLLQPYNNIQHWTASRKLALLIEWGTERLVAISKKMMGAADTIKMWKDEYYKAVANVQACGTSFQMASTFNVKANALWHERNNELLNFYKQWYDLQAKLFLCGTTDRSIYDLNISVLKSSFLTVLIGLHCEFEVGCDKSEEYQPIGKVLPDYDAMNCQYKTELSIPHAEKYFSIKVECNKMTTKFDAKYIKGSLEENLANGKYKGTVEIEAKIGSDKERFGPIEMGTQVKAGAGVEFTEGGIQDVYVSGKAGVKAGDLTLGSVEARVSVVTGATTVSGKGAFSGISIK